MHDFLFLGFIGTWKIAVGGKMLKEDPHTGCLTKLIVVLQRIMAVVHYCTA